MNTHIGDGRNRSPKVNVRDENRGKCCISTHKTQRKHQNGFHFKVSTDFSRHSFSYPTDTDSPTRQRAQICVTHFAAFFSFQPTNQLRIYDIALYLMRGMIEAGDS